MVFCFGCGKKGGKRGGVVVHGKLRIVRMTTRQKKGVHIIFTMLGVFEEKQNRFSFNIRFVREARSHTTTPHRGTALYFYKFGRLTQNSSFFFKRELKSFRKRDAL